MWQYRILAIALAACTGIGIVWFTYAVLSARQEAEKFRSMPFYKARNYIDDLARTKGPESALAFLRHSYLFDGQLRVGGADAHSLAHRIGAAFYETYGRDGIHHCDTDFTYACYHGFVAAFVLEHGPKSPGLASLCDASPDEATCIHGIGHGLEEYEQYDLQAGLADCEELFAKDVTYCYQGVFMDHMSVEDDAYAAAHPWYPCDVVAEKYRFACTPSRVDYLNARHASSSQIARVCLTAPTEAMAQECVRHLGFSIARNQSGDERRIVAECESGFADENARRCVAAAARTVKNRAYVGWQDTVTGLCARVTEQSAIECPYMPMRLP